MPPLVMLQSEKIKSVLSYKPLKRGKFLTMDNLEVEPDVFFHTCYSNRVVTIAPTTLLLGALDIFPTVFNQHLMWKMCDQDQMFGKSIYAFGTKLYNLLLNLQGLMNVEFFSICNSVERVIF